MDTTKKPVPAYWKKIINRFNAALITEAVNNPSLPWEQIVKDLEAVEFEGKTQKVSKVNTRPEGLYIVMYKNMEENDDWLVVRPRLEAVLKKHIPGLEIEENVK